MEQNVFVLGLPGSGKSTAARYIEMLARDYGRTAYLLQDYRILYEMSLADREGIRFRSTLPDGYDGFDVHDLSAFDDTLRELVHQLQGKEQSRRSAGCQWSVAPTSHSLNGGKLKMIRNQSEDENHISHPMGDSIPSVEEKPKNQPIQAANNPLTDPSQLIMLWKMRWFFLVLIALWILAAMAFPVVAFCLTKNPYSFSLFGTLAPPLYILYRITRYLFPKSKEGYELDALRVQSRTEQRHDKNRVT
jgi:hypothetical protein